MQIAKLNLFLICAIANLFSLANVSLAIASRCQTAKLNVLLCGDFLLPTVAKLNITSLAVCFPYIR
jgi:hypothetical protein